MQTDAFNQGYNQATLGDAPNVQTLDNAATILVPRMVMRFASSAARAAVLVGAQAPTPGMVTYLISEDRLEVYQANAGSGTAGWTPVTAGPWVPITFASGYVANTGDPAYRVINGCVELRGTVGTSSGGSLPVNALTPIATLPSGVRPPAYRYYMAATEWASAMYGRVEVHPDGTIQIAIPGGGSAAAAWISLDNVRYSLI